MYTYIYIYLWPCLFCSAPKTYYPRKGFGNAICKEGWCDFPWRRPFRGSTETFPWSSPESCFISIRSDDRGGGKWCETLLEWL